MTIADGRILEKLWEITEALGGEVTPMAEATILGALQDILTAIEEGGGGGSGEDTGWIDIAPLLVNGWVADEDPAYRRINGVVYLRGELDPAASTDPVAFTLPAGFAPDLDSSFCYDLNEGDYTVSVSDGGVVSALASADVITLWPVIYPAATP